MLLYTCTDGAQGTATPNDGLGRTYPVPTCSDGGAWVEVQASIGEFTPADFELIGITTENVFYAFGFGFGAIVLFWFFGYVINAAQLAIKKL